MKNRRYNTRDVYDAIAGFIAQHGYSPSQAEIALACGMASRGSVALWAGEAGWYGTDRGEYWPCSHDPCEAMARRSPRLKTRD